MVIQARKRVVVAFVLALALAWYAVSLSAQVLIPSGCRSFTPWSVEWILRGCYLYTFAPDHPRPVGVVVR